MPIVLTGKPFAGRLHAKAAGHATHLQVTHLILLILTGFIACFTVALLGFAPEYLGICSTGNRPVEAQTRTPEPLPTQSASADFPVQNHPAFQQQALAPAPAVRLNKVAICTSIKWEQPVDLEEWVQYYRWLGVDTIGLVENSETVTPALAEQLAPYIDSGLVHLDAWGDSEPAQIKIFDSCFQRFQHTHDWVAFFDADEYLMMLESGITLDSLLEDYKEYPALAVNWIMFGSSNRLTRPIEGGMLRWYAECRATPEPHIKVIANTKQVQAVLSPHPHNIFYKNDSHAVAENFQRVEHVWGEKCRESGCVEDCKEDCRALPGYTVPLNEVKRVALFHYVTRSWEDFEMKMTRGGGSVLDVRKGLPFFDCTNREANSTGGICDEGIKAWAHCCSSPNPAMVSIR